MKRGSPMLSQMSLRLRLRLRISQNTKGVDPARVVEVISRLGAAVGELGLAGGQVIRLSIRCTMFSSTLVAVLCGRLDACWQPLKPWNYTRGGCLKRHSTGAHGSRNDCRRRVRVDDVGVRPSSRMGNGK